MVTHVDFDKHFIKDNHKTKLLIRELESAGYTGAGLLNNSFARHDRFLREFAPRICEFFNPSERDVVEIGCGVGSVTHAFCDIFRSVTAFEINEASLTICRKRADLFDLDNVNFIYSKPAELVEEALRKGNESTVFILYAVLEHMTEEERLSTLRQLWGKMGPHNYLGSSRECMHRFRQG